MKIIVAQPKQRIADFVAERIKPQYPFDNYTALALVENGEILAGVIYNFYTGTDICMHVAAVPGKRWLNRAFLKAAFDYPFNQLKVRRVTGLVPSKNTDARRFDEHLGFKYEGTLRHALADDDLLLYGLLREDCKWLVSAKRYALAA